MQLLLLLLACSDPDAGRGTLEDTADTDDLGDSGAPSTDTGTPGWTPTGDCGVEEGPPPDDSVLGPDYWTLPVYIAGTDRRFASIQDGIQGAEEGDTVVVTPGTYTGTVDLLGKAITLCSEQGPAVTVIDGAGEGPAVRLRLWEPPETVVQGFTITGGVGEGDETFGPTPHGGGIFVEWGSPTLRHNLVIGNEAAIGGGVYVRNGAATVEHNVIAWNHATEGGGGLTCSACRGRIAHNTFFDNTARQGPAGEYFWGAADNVDNLYVVPEDSPGAFRWLDPRPDVTWTGGPNLRWPAVPLLIGAPDEEWPDHDTWVVSDPGLAPDPEHPAAGWAPADGFGVADGGPYGPWWAGG